MASECNELNKSELVFITVTVLMASECNELNKSELVMVMEY